MRGRPGRRRPRPAEDREQQPQRPGLAAPPGGGGGAAMLPWKRHKFELLATDEEGQQQPQQGRRRERQQLQQAAPRGASPPPPPSGKAKDYCQAGAGSLPCSAALGSLARACPAESALSRMGSLFRSKRKKFRVSSEAPTYTALYLGNATTLQAKGEGCTDVAVAKIWAKSEAGRHGTKMKLTIGPQGIRLAPAVPAEAASRPGHLYLLHRVTYCVADPRLPRLFAWIYRHEVKHKAVLLRCHAVLVSKAEKARAMALLLYQTSAAALAEFRRLKKRADARHQQLQQVGPGADGAIPLVPLRKLLLHGPGGCYKPPVERSRSAPKLGSITEDSLGEELEERAAGPACANGAQDEECDGAQDEEDELLAPLEEEDEDGEGAAPAGSSLGQLICGLGELAIGNDVALLRADLRVTRLLSGESTGSESSIESNGHEGGGGGGGGGGTGGASPPPPLRSCHSPEPDCG
ncbi:protein FAM43A [Thamnophis elegans]|uniref:protein FAM43A n=1 Tax=Thamnophis elegans TaxID=35005 RepID=UPI001377BCD2|nr:protein FAM43A [Thamnophis elegans]